MKNEKELMQKIESLLDELVHNAEKMEAMSALTINEAELALLQQKQAQLISDINACNAEMKTLTGDKGAFGDESAKRAIQEKMAKFQDHNARFIENLAHSRGLIRFEKE
jgi:transcription initiation factor IIE alpha subunit